MKPPRPRCQRPNGLTKISYKSPAKARQAARNMRVFAEAPLRIYECRWCGGWHLTGAENRRNGGKP